MKKTKIIKLLPAYILLPLLLNTNTACSNGHDLIRIKESRFRHDGFRKKSRFIRTEKQKWCRGSDHELRRSYRFYLGTRPERQVR